MKLFVGIADERLAKRVVKFVSNFHHVEEVQDFYKDDEMSDGVVIVCTATLEDYGKRRFIGEHRRVIVVNVLQNHYVIRAKSGLHGVVDFYEKDRKGRNFRNRARSDFNDVLKRVVCEHIQSLSNRLTKQKR